MAVSFLIAESESIPPVIVGIIMLVGGILTLAWMIGVYFKLANCEINTDNILEAVQAILKELRRGATEATELETEESETLLKILAELQKGNSDAAQKQPLPTAQRKSAREVADDAALEALGLDDKPKTKGLRTTNERSQNVIP